MRNTIAGLLLVAFSSSVLAQTTVPHTLISGTAAKASDVNENFQALATAIDNLSAKIAKRPTEQEIVTKATAVNTTNPKYVSVSCPNDSQGRPKIAVGGGAQVLNYSEVFLNQTVPMSSGAGWAAQAEKIPGSQTDPTATWGLQVFAICIHNVLPGD